MTKPNYRITVECNWSDLFICLPTSITVREIGVRAPRCWTKATPRHARRNYDRIVWEVSGADHCKPRRIMRYAVDARIRGVIVRNVPARVLVAPANGNESTGAFRRSITA